MSAATVQRKRGRRVVQLTDAEINATLTGLNEILSCSYGEQVQWFGSAATVRAAARASEILTAALSGR